MNNIPEDLNAIMPCGHRRRFESIIEGGHSSVCQMCVVAVLTTERDELQGQYDTELSANHGCQRELAEAREKIAELQVTVERLKVALRDADNCFKACFGLAENSNVRLAIAAALAPPTPQATKDFGPQHKTRRVRADEISVPVSLPPAPQAPECICTAHTSDSLLINVNERCPAHATPQATKDGK